MPQVTKRIHETDDLVKHPSGATSSKKPRFDQIPYEAAARLAKRYELGEAKHGRHNWLKGIDDPDYVLERLAHVINHAILLSEKLQVFVNGTEMMMLEQSSGAEHFSVKLPRTRSSDA